MAAKRMIAKSIIFTDAFLSMPLSTRCLYFSLLLMADDDGFVAAPQTVIRMVGASDDDLKVLLAKRYVLSFESGVIVIKHWRIHNTIKNDRYNETTYLEEKSTLALDDKGAYIEAAKAPVDTKCIQMYSNSETQISIDKIRLDKYNIYSRAIEYLNSKAGTKYQVKSVANRRHIDARINEGYTFEDFKKVIDIKVAEWLGTDMQKYLRPETLFGSKFESYLNQKEATTTSKKQVKVPEWYDKYQKGLKEEKVESIDEATKQQIEEAARGLFGDES